MSKNKNHLLIIGGTGFIGYHLGIKVIKKKWNVTSVSSKKPKTNRYIKGINYIKLDISNANDLKKKLKGKFSHVINLGGYTKKIFSNLSKKKIKKAQLIGGINLINFFKEKKIKSFIQIGSSAEYGKINSPQKESDICFPKSYYGLIKLIVTNYLMYVSKVHSFPGNVLRFFQIYGPNQNKDKVIPHIIQGCLKNKKFNLSAGNQLRDFCYIDDIVDAIFLLLNKKNIKGEIINIGLGKGISVKKLVNKIKKKFGRGKPVFGKIKFQKDENMKWIPDIKKAKKLLNWSPKVNIDDGLDKLIKNL